MMGIRAYISILVVIFFSSSCQLLRSVQTPFQKKPVNHSSNIVISQPDPKIKQYSGNLNSIEKDENFGPVQSQPAQIPLIFNNQFSIDDAAPIQFKYSIILNIEIERIENLDLYKIIDEWMGTPYKIGGMTQRGIDCSGLVRSVVFGAYKIDLPRTAREQRNACIPINNDELSEGDLVFFNTRGGVSHVGMYLHNNKFVHSSSSYGVIISDLSETYWSRRYLGAGRFYRESANYVGGMKK